MRPLAFVLLVACACPGASGPAVGSGGSGSGSAGGCEALRPKLEQLYRAEAQRQEPKRVEEATADNTTMVLNDCAKAPGRVIPCVEAATTVAELEKRCVLPLDDEGSEGLELK